MQKIISIGGRKIKETVYEVIGIKNDNKIIAYKEGTISEIVDNEMLDDGETVFDTIDVVIKNMDCFSEYQHYYRIVK